MLYSHKDLLVIVAIERWVPAKQNVKNNSATPNITLGVILTIEDIRRNIIRSAKPCFELLVWFELHRCSKINHLHSDLPISFIIFFDK